MKHKKNKKIIIKIVLIILIVSSVYFSCKITETINQKNISKKLKDESWIDKNIKIDKSTINNNVYIINKNKSIEVYNMLYQQNVTKKISSGLEKNDYTADNPLMIYNPYGTNNNSINIYFKDDNITLTSYKIEAKGYETFEKNLVECNEEIQSYQLLGFVLGTKNTLYLNFTNETGEKTTKKYILDFKNYKIATDNKVEITEDNSDELEDGLYAILGDSSDDDYIWLVDNAGIIRGEIPIIGYRAVNLLFKDNEMYFSVSEKKIASMNNLGQITKIYNLGKYKLHHDYTFDEDKNNILVLASDTTKESCEDAIIKLNLVSGKVEDAFYLEEVLPDIRESAYYNKDEVAKEVESVGVDWMHINTINYLPNDTVILSSRETSSVIKVSNIFDSPKVEYILGDEKFYENYESKKYLYTKVGDFTIAGGQHTVSYIPASTSGVYYLTMFNNNIGISTTVPDFTWSSIGLKYSSPEDEGESYYYKYKVDENKKTFELVEKFEVPFSAYMSSVQNYNESIIIDSAQACTFSERNTDGSIKKTYKVNCKSSIYRVFKYNFYNYYFKSAE
jgi:arylsulfate sulfotransferase